MTHRHLRPLLIIGAGGFGRETAEAVRAVNQANPTWNLLGFLDDNPMLLGGTIDGLPVVGPSGASSDYPDALVVVTIGNSDNFTLRSTVVDRLGLPLERYATIIHPAAVVPPSAQVGAGTVILAGTVATSAVSIGTHVRVMPAVVFTHDDKIDDYVTFGSGAHLQGAVHICEGAYIGAGALIRDRRTVGKWSLIGMGSTVITDIPALEVWAGTPARFFRKVVPSDELQLLMGEAMTA